MIRRRARTLAVLELVNVFLLSWLFFGVLHVRPTLPNVLGMTLIALFLLIGAAYWALKYAQLAARHRHPAGMHVFRALNWLGVAALAAGAVVIGLDPTLPAVLFWLFALLEYVNYFHVQLMHDTRADLRRLARTGRPHRSHLRRDLQRPPRHERTHQH
ncbi:hypothetical protein [Dactylosporangium sp. NPDC051541]|uniref:hypothetical protein n=1 Tax=Dactylosporangium sp. NPDC051541 TaxID=3363977 RepID=UPI0037A6BBC8